MLSVIASGWGFAVLLGLFGLGALGSLAGRHYDRFSNAWGHGLAIVGSLWGLVFAGAVLGGIDVSVRGSVSNFLPLPLTFEIDKLAAFFVLIICLVAFFCSVFAVGYVREFYKRYSVGRLGFFYNVFLVAMILVVTSANAIVFLIAWEIMSLASYFLVIYDGSDAKNIAAGYLYLVMTHVGTAFIGLAVVLLYGFTQSFDFAIIAQRAELIPVAVKAIVFVLAFIGLGTKAGVIPFHIWLPSAHPAAPSHVSALMSGVMIKTGIYLMIRMFFGMLGPVPVWWGVVMLLIGSVSCVLGVLYALTEHDVKRLLAFHSIENIGIILLGLGAALVFSAQNQPQLMLLALAAALFHTLNHAVFKSLLFLSAGSVIQHTHTRNIEQYGGLMKLMPVTGLSFLIGAMAISALPPFNGFYSEWLTFQSLFQGAADAQLYVRWAFLVAAGALALTGGLALACFVKAFGATFLARPRSAAVKHARESSGWMQLGMLGLVAMCVVLGAMAGPVVALLQRVGEGLTAQAIDGSRAHASLGVLPAGNYAVVSAPLVLGLLLLIPVLVWLMVRFGVYRRQKVQLGDTWDCGTDFTPRMEMTSTGFARSLITIFRPVLLSRMDTTVEYDTGASQYAPRSRRIDLMIRDVYRLWMYQPVYDAATWLSHRMKMIQNGNINAYVLYIFVILVFILVVGV